VKRQNCTGTSKKCLEKFQNPLIPTKKKRKTEIPWQIKSVKARIQASSKTVSLLNPPNHQAT
jgi:hypothetical protein